MDRTSFEGLLAGHGAGAITSTKRKRQPALVVVSASKPRPVKMCAVPAFQGFGITNAPGRACRA
jgi:hypothetical protein